MKRANASDAPKGPSTHADVIRAKRDAVVEAAKAVAARLCWLPGTNGRDEPNAAEDEIDTMLCRVDALIAAEQAACGECKGEGRMLHLPEHAGATGYEYECPACHGTGRKPDKEEANG